MTLYFKQNDPYYKEPTAHARWRLLQWVNSTVSSHDAICDCDRALDHLFSLVYCPLGENIQQQLKKKGFHPEKRCLTSSDPVGDATGEGLTEGGPEGDIEPGELEELFAETGEEEETTTG